MLRLSMRTVYDASDVSRTIDTLVDRIAASFSRESPLNIVGIRTRGEILAERIAVPFDPRGFSQIGRGVLDITLYRDDLSEIGPRPMVRPTQLDIDIDDMPLLLVDDVLFTGRSVRAALDALSDFGRPSADSPGGPGRSRRARIADPGGFRRPDPAGCPARSSRECPAAAKSTDAMKFSWSREA